MGSFCFRYAHIVTVFWITFVLAISFFETPLKFTSPMVSTEIGVSIGMILFPKLNLLEWILGTILLGCHFRHLIFPPTSLLAVITLLSIQSFYLLPELHDRAQALITGQPLAYSFHHHAFVGVEVLKIILLITLVIHQIKFYETNSNKIKKTII